VLGQVIVKVLLVLVVNSPIHLHCSSHYIQKNEEFLTKSYYYSVRRKDYFVLPSLIIRSDYEFWIIHRLQGYQGFLEISRFHWVSEINLSLDWIHFWYVYPVYLSTTHLSTYLYIYLPIYLSSIYLSTVEMISFWNLQGTLRLINGFFILIFNSLSLVNLLLKYSKVDISNENFQDQEMGRYILGTMSSLFSLKLRHRIELLKSI